MDGHDSSPQNETSSWLNRDLPWLVVLLFLVASLRCWLLVNTEVTARDSVGFIRYALLFDNKSWSETLLSQHQHPGYPAIVWLVAKPFRAAFGTTPEVMRVAAQLVSLFAATLLGLVMFHLGKRLWDRFVGFWAALLFQAFPISGHHLSDGISDGLFLLLVATSLLLLVRALETGQPWRFGLGGLFIGFAYMTRPEGALVLPAMLVILVAFQVVRAYRQPWPLWSRGVAALVLGCVIAGSPYFVATGRFTNKVSARQILEEAEAIPSDLVGGPLFASTFTPSTKFSEQFTRTLRALILEVGQAFNYVGGFVAIWAMLFCGPALVRKRGAWLIAVYFAMHALVLVKLGLKVSYVSDRHVMVLVMLGCFPCVLGMAHLCSLSIGWFKIKNQQQPGFLYSPGLQCFCAFWLVVSLGICLSKTTSRLHGNRIANHQAGLWLAQHAQPIDVVEDDHNWSHFYAGHLFLEGRELTVAANAKPQTYVVMTRSKDAETMERRLSQEEALKKDSAQLVYYWPTQGDPDKARLVVYRQPRNYATHPWAKDETPAPVFHNVSRTNQEP